MLDIKRIKENPEEVKRLLRHSAIVGMVLQLILLFVLSGCTSPEKDSVQSAREGGIFFKSTEDFRAHIDLLVDPADYTGTESSGPVGLYSYTRKDHVLEDTGTLRLKLEDGTYYDCPFTLGVLIADGWNADYHTSPDYPTFPATFTKSGDSFRANMKSGNDPSAAIAFNYYILTPYYYEKTKTNVPVMSFSIELPEKSAVIHSQDSMKNVIETIGLPDVIEYTSTRTVQFTYKFQAYRILFRFDAEKDWMEYVDVYFN